MTWLIFALVVAALAVIVWVARERRGQRTRKDDWRRTVEERQRAREERADRRRRLGLPPEDDR